MVCRGVVLRAGLVVALVAPEVVNTSVNAVRRPQNLLLITLDTMRADRLPVYGFTGVATPALDRIAAEGTVFDAAFAAVPLTLPSHAALFTGFYPPRLAVRDNTSPPLSSSFTTLAEALRERHLRTAAFVASAVLAPERGLEQGFEVYSAGDATRCSGGAARRRADAVVDEALGWLGHHAAEPFFAWLHLYDTHRPYDLPAEYTDAYLDPYLAAIAFEDAQIARVIGHLEARGLLSSTLVVIVGDHGESLGDHGEDSHGIFVYQEALRVPFVMRGPGVPPRRILHPVRLIDVMPTVLDLFGLPELRVEGISLTQGGRFSVDDPEVYAESMYPKRFGWAPLRSLRADRYKLIDAPTVELYDLARDPGEQRNVVAEHPAVAAVMLRRLRTFDSKPEGPAFEDVDAAVLDRINSLGYVSRAPSTTTAAPDLSDPKDTIDAFNRMTAMQWQQTEKRRAWCR